MYISMPIIFLFCLTAYYILLRLLAKNTLFLFLYIS